MISLSNEHQTHTYIHKGAWHILPTEYYEKYALREREGDLGTVFDDALKEHDTFVYFHGNALHRASPWRVEFYKVWLTRAFVITGICTYRKLVVVIQV